MAYFITITYLSRIQQKKCFWFSLKHNSKSVMCIHKVKCIYVHNYTTLSIEICVCIWELHFMYSTTYAHILKSTQNCFNFVRYYIPFYEIAYIEIPFNTWMTFHAFKNICIWTKFYKVYENLLQLHVV